MIHPKHPFRNKKPINTTIFKIFPTDGMTALREAWYALRHEEATAEPYQLEGLARRRMMLLAAFPEAEIPNLIDKLNAEPEEAIA